MNSGGGGARVPNNNSTGIGDGKVVSVHYTLKNDKGDVLDSSQGGDALAYIHGTGGMIPGFEQALTGRGAGEKLSFKVSPEDGYGVRDKSQVQKVPRSSFPSDAEIEPGMQFGVQGPDGQVMPVWVQSVDGSHVTLDLNHPLAGENLNFSVEVLEVRDATKDELDHGHVHGPHGH